MDNYNLVFTYMALVKRKSQNQKQKSWFWQKDECMLEVSDREGDEQMWDRDRK